MCEAEQRLGLDSLLLPTDDPARWPEGENANIHVMHSHIPDAYFKQRNGAKVIAVQHGTPEHCFEGSVKAGEDKSVYAPGDSMGMSMHYCRFSDGVVTFWPRHAAIWQTFTDRPVFVIPMGVDKGFWKPLDEKPPKLAGFPSFFCAENMHNIKWPLDMMFMWPYISEAFPNARLHIVDMPYDQHRFWFPLATMNGAIYTANITAARLSPEPLRNFFNACDYYFSPVRYGDFNKVCLEAKASGAKVISFRGNEYADYWIPEGDQREQLETLIAILKGWKQPRLNVTDVTDISQTAIAMMEVYKRVMNDS